MIGPGLADQAARMLTGWWSIAAALVLSFGILIGARVL